MAKSTGKEDNKNVAPSSEVAPYDWSKEASTGFEGTKAEDLGIPFLQIIQKGSPEFDETHKDHPKKRIEGVKPGMIINSLSRKIVYSGDKTKPLKFIPCYAEKLYPEFKTRDSGGGFVKMHRDPNILLRTERNEKNKDILVSGSGEGNEIITTHYFYGFAQIEGAWEKVIIGMTSTQLKNGRRWLNMMQSIKINGVTPPMFSHSYNVMTDIEKNNEGSWYGWNFEVSLMLNPNIPQHLEMVQNARKVANDMAKSLALPAHSEQEE
jgi:hypothetical protein